MGKIIILKVHVFFKKLNSESLTSRDLERLRSWPDFEP